ncbi:coiled-coil domain-containing protein 28A [Dicentrarchus labrax]|uniref:coiled-coil domain-containing protein 28A n=1 Tax=Dicentrarchus labrax TaxID=13489 RepID=UPI0016391DFB|nr:coiled-coil domain-containing protein 28A [Dicentrarchus labrax]XP_051283391.1 coiled-coil domain-containing protein 28A [Dicentrarchus labrax]XP_051283393.1 coiled-coil domain-containing protein 28A [Dicentrarchus labrax]XP_051283394.1 coiled-coil domain-containing protein 28A [Dicentrarchus labrax]
MEERKLKRKSPRTSNSTAAPTGGSGRKTGASAGGRHVGYSHNMGTHSSQKSKSRRAVRDKSKHHLGLGAKANQSQGQAAPTIQHSFLTDVSDVQEMENGLLSLLNDFHSGKLQAFGNECSIGQMEHVREMQEKLARLHFDLYGEVDEMPEDQRKMACDTNMDKLLLNLEELSSSIQKLNLADSQEIPRTASV